MQYLMREGEFGPSVRHPFPGVSVTSTPERPTHGFTGSEPPSAISAPQPHLHSRRLNFQ